MYQQGGTIRGVLDSIISHEYVLPAIQREFVWSPEQICRLFDSVMQGYPFGDFLLWRIKAENSGRYRYYDFVREYHERDNPHCPDLGVLADRPITAVLDGQQRLTAFNIGLRGSMAIKVPRLWRHNPLAFPRQVLALDLLAQTDPDEKGNRYAFEFRKETETGRQGNSLWFKVSDVLTLQDGASMLKYLKGRDLDEEQLSLAFGILERLSRVVHVDPTVAYYEEKEQDIERVLNIFIRRNSGGTVLSYTDLLLSIAVSHWDNLDARKAVHELVDSLNGIGTGFTLSKDFVLKAGLMLTDIASVGFRVENFTHENMAKLEEKWLGIRDTLIATVQLAASFGFNGRTIRADSALLPIAYYLYRQGAPAGFATQDKYRTSREAIRGWLTRSILKSGIWGSGLDTLLTALREVIREDASGQFPVENMRRRMASRGKTLEFVKEEIDDLADMKYSDHRVFAMLSLLFPFVDLRNRFHVDHVFPRSHFTTARLRRAGVSEDRLDIFQDYADRLPNLQLLDGDENQEKQATLPAKWLREHFGNDREREAYCERHSLGHIPDSITDFETFYENRRERLTNLIEKLVNTVP